MVAKEGVKEGSEEHSPEKRAYWQVWTHDTLK